MLNSKEAMVIHKAERLLRRNQDAESIAIADALHDIQQVTMAQRTSMAEARSRHGPGGRGRTPSAVYVLEVTPGYVQHLTGARAAHAALVEALTELGAPKRAPTEGSLATQLSRTKEWCATVDTDNGTISVTVTKARKPT